MKKISILCLFAVLAICRAQAQQVETDVNIGVLCPDRMENLSFAGISRLRQKIEQIATSNGVATSSDGTFVIYPSFSVFDSRTVEGGMKNIVVIKAEMVLSVAEISTGMKVNSVSTTLSGSGYSQSEALSNALSEIDVRDSVYARFLSESKKRIYTYYETNCAKLIQKAAALAAQQQYEAALAELACYPTSLPSYAKVGPVMIDVYKRYQNVQCAKLIQEAKGCVALKDYARAIKYLSQVDPESQCRSECTNLINNIKQQVDKAETDEIARQFRVFDTLVGLEKYRISAAREIAKAYYSSRPTIHYTQIVK